MTSGEPFTGTARRSYRIDLSLGLIISVGVLFFSTAIPVRSESYYIDWIAGGWLGVLLGISESWMTVARFRAWMRGPFLVLEYRRRLPEGVSGGLGLLLLLGLGYLVIVVWPGPVAELTKTPLFVFNMICGGWWTMWVIYFGVVLVWSILQGRRHGTPVRVAFVMSH